MSFALGSFAASGGAPFLGVVRGGAVTPATELGFADDATLFDLLQDWPASLDALERALVGADGIRVALADLTPCAPVPQARQIFCTGANYGRHVVEMVVALGVSPETDGMDAQGRERFGERYVERQRAEAEPYVFMKPVTAIAGPCDTLELPLFSDRADWEIELAAVIGVEAWRADRADALRHVAGYMVANDLTARDKVRRSDPGAIGADWLAGKGSPGFLPTGPWFVPAKFVPDPHDLGLRLLVNGEVMQDGRTSDMTFDIPRQIEWISRHARMLPGDILCTGSPAGNGVVRGLFLKNGDVMEAEIEGLGRQVTRCVASSGR